MNRRYPDWARPLALAVCGALLALAACFGDGPPTPYDRCLLAGGQWIARPQPDTRSGIANYCSFPNGTECAEAQVRNDTCAPVRAALGRIFASDAPVSPLSPPISPVSPLATPQVSVSPGAALHLPIMLGMTPLTAPSPAATDSNSVASGEWVNPFIDTYPIGSIDRPPLPPGSLAELVNSAPLIFIGKVGPVTRYIDFCRTTEDGKLLKECPAADVYGNPAPGYPLTEFLLEAEIVIRDDWTIWRGEPIILRQIGHITEELVQMSPGGAYPYNFTGDRFLFLLTRFPEGEVYGLAYGPWSRLIVDGTGLRVSDGTQAPLQFGGDQPITLSEFIQVAETSPDSTLAPPDTSAPPPSDASVPDSLQPSSPLAMPGCSGVAGDMVYPTSLEELVDRASLIFFGTVGPVVQYLEYCGYEDGQLLEKCKATDMAGNPAPGFPLTYFVMHVEKAIRDDGRIARGEPIILAEMGHVTPELKQLSQHSTYPLSYTGDRYLYLLGSNPDGETYGAVYGPRGRLIVDGEILRISDCEQSPLRFAENAEPITLGDFVKFVESR